MDKWLSYRDMVLRTLYKHTFNTGKSLSYNELMELSGLNRSGVLQGVNSIHKMVDTKVEKSVTYGHMFIKLIKFNDAYMDIIK